VLLNEIAGNRNEIVRTDPVCGLALDPESASPTFEAGGVRHWFCSDDCRRRFVKQLGAP
jgi:YHS domain-containing protein